METEAPAADGVGAGGGLSGSAGLSRPIGAALAAARAARGLDLADVARETRVPLRHLAAIEADNHDALPALPYAIGFVKAFARTVGIDPDAAATAFRAETSKAAHVPAQPTMTPIDERRLPPRGVVVASVAALIGVGALIIAWSDGAFDAAPPAAPVETAAVPVTAGHPATLPPPAAASAGAVPVTAGATAGLPVAVPPASGATVAGAPPPGVAATPASGSATAALPASVGPAPSPGATAAVPPTGRSGVVIMAGDDAWFKVSVWDPAVGKVVTVKTGVLAKGERYVPPPTPGLRLWTGRAGALTITVDGRPIPPLGGPVETVKNVSLDPADLRARLAAPPTPTAAPLFAPAR